MNTKKVLSRLKEKIRKKETKKQKKSSPNIFDFYYNEKIKPNSILLEPIGKWAKGNLVYVVFCLASGTYGAMDIYYSVNENTIEFTKAFFDHRGIKNINYVIAGSQDYFKALSSCKYLINEADFPNYWIKKPKQVYVNIWHGTPLKKIGLAQQTKQIHLECNRQRNFNIADYILCPNNFTRDVILDDFYVRNTSKAKLIMKGYPRTGKLLEADNKAVDCNEYKIAFMPTWREGKRVEEQHEAILYFLSKMDQKLTHGEHLYVNLHHKILEQYNINYEEFYHISPFPKDKDVYEVLCQIDCLITDYSSLMFDFAVTKKPIILYCTDLMQYERERGFYFDIHKLPFPIVDTVENVKECIESFRKDGTNFNYQDKKMICDFSEYDDADNTEALIQTFLQKRRKHTEAIQRTYHGKSTIIYSETMDGRLQTKRLQDDLMAMTREEGSVYLSYECAKVKEDITSAYPLLQQIPSFGCKGKHPLTSHQKSVKRKYDRGTISRKEMIRELKSAFKISREKRYGKIKIDTWLIFDCSDYLTFYEFSTYPGKKLLILSEKILELIQTDVRVKDAVDYYVKKCKDVFAFQKKEAVLFRTIYDFSRHVRVIQSFDEVFS